jgi:hypothetical protein
MPAQTRIKDQSLDSPLRQSSRYATLKSYATLKKGRRDFGQMDEKRPALRSGIGKPKRPCQPAGAPAATTRLRAGGRRSALVAARGRRHVRSFRLWPLTGRTPDRAAQGAHKQARDSGRAGGHGATIVGDTNAIPMKGVQPCALTSYPEAPFRTTNCPIIPAHCAG